MVIWFPATYTGCNGLGSGLGSNGSMVWGFCVYFVYMIPLETDVLRKHRFQKCCPTKRSTHHIHFDKTMHDIFLGFSEEKNALLSLHAR